MKTNDNMAAKDRRAYKRYTDEIKLKTDISKLIRDFSEKYDVECTSVFIQRNEFYGKNESTQPPMYLLNLVWKFDYMAH